MQTEIKIKLLPGLIKWLEGQKDPDGLIMKLLIDYRLKTTLLKLKKEKNDKNI